MWACSTKERERKREKMYSDLAVTIKSQPIHFLFLFFSIKMGNFKYGFPNNIKQMNKVNAKMKLMYFRFKRFSCLYFISF